MFLVQLHQLLIPSSTQPRHSSYFQFGLSLRLRFKDLSTAAVPPLAGYISPGFAERSRVLVVGLQLPIFTSYCVYHESCRFETTDLRVTVPFGT